MKLENYPASTALFHLLSLGKLRDNIDNHITRDTTLVQNVIGDMIEKCSVHGLLRKFQTYLSKANTRRHSNMSLSSVFVDMISDLDKREAKTSKTNLYRPLEITTTPRGNNI